MEGISRSSRRLTCTIYPNGLVCHANHGAGLDNFAAPRPKRTSAQQRIFASASHHASSGTWVITGDRFARQPEAVESENCPPTLATHRGRQRLPHPQHYERDVDGSGLSARLANPNLA
jgi:hypothetical protein